MSARAQGARFAAGMDSSEFSRIRRRLGRRQRELSAMLGVSVKAVESYEQGWRRIPTNVERLLYFLLFALEGGNTENDAPCWDDRACARETRKICVAWAAREGRLCWFYTGGLCGGTGPRACRSCAVFLRQLARTGGEGAPAGKAGRTGRRGHAGDGLKLKER